MKLIALELCVLMCERLLTIVGSEQSDQPEFVHGMYFSPFISLLQLRETLLNTIYVVEIAQPFRQVYTVAGLKTDTLPDAEGSAASLHFSNNFLDPILSLSNTRT